MRLELLRQANRDAASTASSALAKLTRLPTKVRVSEVEAMGERPRVTIDEHQPMFGVYMPIKGGMVGAALLCFPEATARQLAALVIGRVGVGDPMDAMVASALMEIGNIICGNYISVLANALRAKIFPGPPHLARGMMAPIVERLVARLGERLREGLLVKVKIGLDGKSATGELLILMAAERDEKAR